LNRQLVAARIDPFIQWLVMLGFLTLPYTHLKWMPDLGLTRPVSIVFFALAFGLVGLQALLANRLNLRAWLAWPVSWDNWPMLRWWLGLMGLGLLSAALTPFYGLPREAFTRLLGYVAIFITLFMGAYSLPRYGMPRVARWIVWGYLPVMVYALVEIVAIFKQPEAIQWIQWFRATFLVPFSWASRLSLLATEPSFVGFQILLLALILPYVTPKWLKWCGWALVLVCLIFTLSGTAVGLIAIYAGLWLLFSFSRRVLARLVWVTAGAGGLALWAVWWAPLARQAADHLTTTIFAVERMKDMSISFQIRFYYVMNLVYAMLESRGLGLGIGQYGYFWREIYLRNIDYTRFDLYGEVHRALTVPGDYVKPWSVILGVGVDLGLLGLALLVGFFIQVYRQLAAPRHRAMFLACLVGLMGAYPIVTPHLWLALALMAGAGAVARLEPAHLPTQSGKEPL